MNCETCSKCAYVKRIGNGHKTVFCNAMQMFVKYPEEHCDLHSELEINDARAVFKPKYYRPDGTTHDTIWQYARRMVMKNADKEVLS